MLGLKSPYDVALRDAKAKREEEVRLEGVPSPKLQEISRAAYPLDQRSGRAAEIKYLDQDKLENCCCLT